MNKALTLASLAAAILACQTAHAQQVVKNNRSTQFQAGGGKVILDALEKGHPACHRRLVNTYPLTGQALVARDGTLHDKGASRTAATEAFVCALALSDLMPAVKAEVMGMPIGAAQAALVDLFKQRVGQQSKVVWNKTGERLKIAVSQSDGYKRPYLVTYAPLNQSVLTVDQSKESQPVHAQLPGQIEGGKLDNERQEFLYYATGRVNAFSATQGNWLITYREGAFKVLNGGRPYFDLSADIIGGLKVTLDDSGALSFEFVR